ncbi:MAG: hypothetical protein WDN25_20970 [Acetobacteraceae bacterium]
MAVIATLTERPGIARIFFDLRATAPRADQERRIVVAMEAAVAMADAHAQTPLAATDAG